MIDKLVDRLKQKIETNPDQCFFNAPAEWDEIESLEDDLIYVFPVSFKVFLCHFNGGFISLLGPAKTDDIESSAWNSNYILSLQEIRSAYERIEHKFHEDGKRYIPFMHTSGQEYLAFRWPYDEDETESKVYDIWHETFPTEWETQIVYDGFTDLLEDYINNNGVIQTIG
ncbi:MAG: SMI1/KNR4 family protein [Bacteroidales bacterium]|nr:SMI1/KNR4 family protein [Bacteroidales bacterium]MCF8398840.1 SMI1/KNR4 family protein [Bacteroidales bacterium]